MKYVCDRCERLVVLGQFQAVDGVLELTCSACGAKSFSGTRTSTAVEPSFPAPSPSTSSPRLVSAPGASNVVSLRPLQTEFVADAAAAANADPFTAPTGFCPRCVTPRAESAAACPACGLLFANAVNLTPPPAWLPEAWKQLLRSWGDERAHTLIRTRALETSGLADVGRLYRVRLAARPDDPIAAHGRDEVLRLALLPAPNTAAVSPEDTPQSRRWQLFFAGLFVLFGIAAVGWMASRMLSPE